MKHTSLSVALALVLQAGIAQPTDNSFTFIQNKMIEYDNHMQKEFGTSLSLVRFETGILISHNNKLSDVMNRRLLKGFRYIIFVYTDGRINDLKMTVKPSGKTNGETFNKNVAKDAGGDYEIATITPEESDTYRISLESDMNTEQTGRYGLMIWLQEISSNASNSNPPANPNAGKNNTTPSTPGTNVAGNKFFSVKDKRICYYNKTTKKYDDCQNFDESSLFELNAAGTVFKHTTPDMSSTYYVQKTYYSQKDRWTEYDVVSDVGNKYTFVLPDEGTSVLIMKSDGDNSYILSFVVIRTWTEKK